MQHNNLFNLQRVIWLQLAAAARAECQLMPSFWTDCMQACFVTGCMLTC